MTKTYHLRITDPMPAMTQEKVVFQAESYSAAVDFAHSEWRKVRRSVTLHSGEWDMYFWHRIDSNGVAIDRNTNSGIPQESRVA